MFMMMLNLVMIDVEIEPAVDLDNPQSKNQRYDKTILLLGNMVKKESLGFRAI